MSARALEILRQAVWASLEAAETVNALVWLPPFDSVGIARGWKQFQQWPMMVEGGGGTKRWMDTWERCNRDQNPLGEGIPEESVPYVTSP